MDSVVVVLGRKLEPNGTASTDLVNRIEEARRLLVGSLKGKRNKIVLSGGRLVFKQDDSNVSPPSEASVMCNLLLADGLIDASAVVLDENSTHTLENAVFARQRVEELLAKLPAIHKPNLLRVHLVTSEVHMPRASACFRGVFESTTGTGDIRYELELHSAPDGQRVIPSEKEGAIEAAMLRRLPYDLELYRTLDVHEARRQFFTPNPEGIDGEPHPHTWLWDPVAGAPAALPS